jgi:hypothetical protein
MFEMAGLNLIYDLLQTTKISSKSLEYNKFQNLRRIYFVICRSCIWRASYFGVVVPASSYIPHCYVWNSNNNTELMPISTDESFMVDYDSTRRSN